MERHCVLVATFLLMLHIVHAQDQIGFISVDCGLAPRESPYNEAKTGLTYTSDDGLVNVGKPGRIAKEFEPLADKPTLTLRYFPEGVRNCYNLNVTSDTNYLIKATFVYGNYDGLNVGPNFDLYFGPNLWTTVSSNDTIKEIIHVTKTNSLQVCLIKTGISIPFINVLELRPMKKNMYVTQGESLNYLFRVYISNSSTRIRFPDDVYDRKWYPYFDNSWTQVTTTLDVNTSLTYELPQSVMAKAATPIKANDTLNITWTVEPPTTKFYSYMHFAELQTLRANDAREFNVTMNGIYTYGPYSPKPLKTETIYDKIPEQCDGGACLLQVVKTLKSTLPPLLNAIEAFTVIDFPQMETNGDDVDAIKNVQDTYGISRISWQGDPCVPKLFLWDGLNCNNSDNSTSPIITSLDLSSSGLTGSITQAIQNLTNLQELDLSDNNLTGEIPDFLFGRSDRREEDDVELRWAALERLPTYDRLRKGMLPQTMVNGKIGLEDVDVTNLAPKEKKHLMEMILKFVEEDNEKFLRRLRERTDRVGIEVPKIEVRYENLSVEGDVRSASRALPTLFNVTLNTIESILGLFHLLPSKKRKIEILKDISGIIKPSRMTLLLGPPSSGKTTLLQALAGKLDDTLQMSGRITYCGHEFREFVPQKTCAYISQHDLHFGEMTVRESLDFSGRCLGVGTRYQLLTELSRREREAGIKPDPEIDAFMKSIAISGQETSLVTDYVLKLLGLDICADTLVGDVMRRGISGGQRKRLTTGEMLVGPATALFMDEISTGLDSSTTFQICKFMRQLVHIADVTMVISLLQPAPETFELFDDIILLSEGQIVYQGSRDNVLEFFEYMGFKCPERKGIADFLQEVTSKKDQEQYWNRREHPYSYVSVHDFSSGFNSFHAGQQLASEFRVPYDKAKTHPAALVTQKYGISNKDLFKACFDREWLLMKRNSFVYVFKTVQITIMSLIAMTVYFRTEMHVGTVQDGQKFYGALFFSLINLMFNGMAELAFTVMRLPVFFKQRDFLFYPPWAFALPGFLLKIPLSLIESVIWIALTYYTIGFAPSAARFFRQLLAYFCVNQMALSLFRFLGALGRTEVIANSGGTLALLVVFVLGGFIISKDDIPSWLTWCYYTSPMMYGQTALVINEFLDERWGSPNNDTRINAKTVGEVLLKSRGFFTEPYWFWICIGALLGFTVLFNFCYIIALMYLNPLGNSKATTVVEEGKDKHKGSHSGTGGSVVELTSTSSHGPKKGMVLPFQPLSLAFNNVNYYVDMPAEMKAQGVEGDRLQLLRDVGGAFRPGVLTALVGVSGAGKTTLMDVLAGRKTGGYVEGSINISGYPKNQATFARVSGYCEQNDIHSPHVTVYESLIYSAWLRLSADIDTKTREMFVEEVMELVELKPLRNSIVGLPGVDGLSTEQRKRLTIAVELVANPSIIFMDEPTSGLDARAAAIVMRTVRNTVDTGRTVVCTIHQPSIDIFESFDELLLMKRGGQVIYAGTLGHHSQKLVEYFEAIEGVPKIKDGYNPATWMLDVTTPSMESQMSVDFAQIFVNSSVNRRNQELIKELSTPPPGSNDLYFRTKYAQPFSTQTKACFWKMYWSNWRYPQYNAIRFLMTVVIGVLFGLLFWQTGTKIEKEQDLNNFFGAMYAAVLFLGATNAATVQPAVAIERTVFYREKAAGMYSAIPYAISQVAVEIMYNTIQTGVYTLILYSMIGYDWTVVKFFWFYYYMLTCFVYFTLYGMMLVALTPNYQIAGICLSFFLSFWNLFSGFLIPRPQIPIWWRWYYWASPVAWTLYGIITSQVGDRDSIVHITGVGDMSLKTLLKNGFGFDYDFLPVVAVVHIAWILIFLFAFAYGIKFLNFQRR